MSKTTNIAVSSRTRKIVEFAQTQVRNSDEEFNFVDECQDNDVSETEDNLEEISEERDEIDGNSEDNEEFMEMDIEDMWFSKDQTFWLKNPLIRKRTRSKNVIKCPPGVSRQASKTNSIVEIFKLFISSNIVNMIVEFTNQKGSRELENSENNWKDVDDIEIYAFIGLLVCSGACKGNREPVRMLWNDDFSFKRPIYSATMSRNRFTQISSKMRFDNMDTRQERRQSDRMAPIRNVFDLFAGNCKNHYNPGSYLTVDEQLVPFRGRCPFRVYMKSKPAKYGIKIWILADVDTAYCKNLQVYLGKTGNAPERDQGKRVVMDLVSILPPGHGITTDNFFTSLDLAEQLLDKNLTICGTLRKNKSFVPLQFLPSPNRPVCSSLFGFQSEMTLVSYVPKKNKSVILLSSEHRDKEISDEPHKKPEIICHYNAIKGAVDTLDKMVAEYTCNRQSKRWPAVLFMNIVDIAAVNAYVLWTNLHPEWNDQYFDKRRLFLLDLAKQLVQPHMQRRVEDPEVKCKLPKSTINDIMSILKSINDNTNTEEQDIAKEKNHQPKQGRCHVCPRKKDKKIRSVCSLCKKHVCAEHSKCTNICQLCNKYN